MAATAELELKSVADKAEATSARRKFGPYVGMYAGESLGQEGIVRIGGTEFPMNDVSGSAVFGMQIGKSWRVKRVPVMFSVQFDGTFNSTNLNGSRGNFNGAVVTNDVVTYDVDMNSLFFSLGGSVSLDLWRYRARIGKVLAGFRPYVGAGLGGGQVWFGTPIVRSDSQVNHGGTTPATTPSFVNEFIDTWHWYAGLEWSWEDRYSIFAEYRNQQYGDMDNLYQFSSDGYLFGFRYRY
jgi:opacity protein-like surface antigen